MNPNKARLMPNPTTAAEWKQPANDTDSHSDVCGCSEMAHEQMWQRQRKCGCGIVKNCVPHGDADAYARQQVQAVRAVVREYAQHQKACHAIMLPHDRLSCVYTPKPCPGCTCGFETHLLVRQAREEK